MSEPQSTPQRHWLARDCRGWYCLECLWPGAEFTWNQDAALQHSEQVHGGVR